MKPYHHNLAANLAERQASANAFAESLSGVIANMAERGLSQRAMVSELNARGIRTLRGYDWMLSSLQRTMARIETMAD